MQGRTSFGESTVLSVLYPLKQLAAFHAERSIEREFEESHFATVMKSSV